MNAQELVLRAVRPVQTERVAQKVERVGRNLPNMRLGFVHRQLQRAHHVPHDGHGLIGRAPAADHKVVRVVDDPGAEPGRVAQRLPTQHEPLHVQVRRRTSISVSLRL